MYVTPTSDPVDEREYQGTRLRDRSSSRLRASDPAPGPDSESSVVQRLRAQ